MRLPGEPGPVLFWRLDDARYAAAWDSGEGARRAGGRWSPAGLPVVYCSLDPSTAILEVAVHKGFDTLNRVPHVLTTAALAIPWDDVRIVRPNELPNRLWRYPTAASGAQQSFGADLLRAHTFVVLPSAVSRWSWNLLIDTRRAAEKYTLTSQEPLDLDPRLNPPW
jgi:RES domain-containing protein